MRPRNILTETNDMRRLMGIPLLKEQSIEYTGDDIIDLEEPEEVVDLEYPEEVVDIEDPEEVVDIEDPEEDFYDGELGKISSEYVDMVFNGINTGNVSDIEVGLEGIDMPEEKTEAILRFAELINADSFDIIRASELPVNEK
jgi:hypothetical protein